MSGHVRAQHGSSSTSFPQRPPDITGTWRSVNGKVLSGLPCRGSWSITRASYAPPETVFNIMRNSSKCCDACSHSYVMISRWLPGLPSIWLSRSRTPWLSSWPGNKRTGRTVHNNPIMMAWMRLIVMILAPVLLPQLAVTAGHCLDIKHLVYMPIGDVALKIYVPCKNFHVPSYYLYKSCKAYVYYCKKNKYMPRMKSHLTCRASNHKSLCALGQIYMPWARGHAFMSSSLSECEVWGKTGPHSIHFHGRAARAISRYCGGNHTWTRSACTEVKAKECHVTTKWQET